MDNPQITVILLGKSEVGKSSIHYRFCSDDFDPPYQSTFGIRFKTQYIQVKGMTYAITLWDTAGEEKYKSVSPDYYKDAQVALIVYDTTNRESFETLKYWVDESKKHGPANQIIIIVGNMIDKINEQKVTEEEAISYANKLGITHQLISCKENKGMTELYESIVLDFNSKIKKFAHFKINQIETEQFMILIINRSSILSYNYNIIYYLVNVFQQINLSQLISMQYFSGYNIIKTINFGIIFKPIKALFPKIRFELLEK